MIQGVITGDIVGSSKLSLDERKALLTILNDTVSGIKTHICNDISFEIFRGDSFQLVVKVPSHSLVIAILIRAALRANSPEHSRIKWDARLTVGIGTIDYESDLIATSDGEAFRNSGRGFDKLKKNERLSVQTPWDDFNKELEVSTGFADGIITKWTQKQAEAIVPDLLTNSSRKEIAQRLDKTFQNVGAALINAKMPLIKKYIHRFQQKIEAYYGSK